MSIITTIQSTDIIANSRTDINNNFSNLNTDKQEKGSGVTGHIVTFGAGNILGDSGQGMPSGTIVGTSDTQVLTNKTLTSPVINVGSDATGDIYYRNSGALTRLPIGGANTVLHGGASIPVYSAVVEADITLADNTTNNSSTSNHGFLKKLDNNSAHFMDGTGNWSAPSSGVYKNGETQRVANTASGTQNIAHGLGKIPVYVRISIVFTNTSGEISRSDGVYNGTTNSCIFSATSGTTILTGVDGTNGCVITEKTNTASQKAVITFDGTNIILTWTYVPTLTGNNMQILWEAIG